mmetsp:Transcript_20223/g.48219  ORF Transcript_20223/g.48219 Transcript_20223/m.48219 type:complete len:96 (+) Transcript_20223:233-520(+)
MMVTNRSFGWIVQLQLHPVNHLSINQNVQAETSLDSTVNHFPSREFLLSVRCVWGTETVNLLSTNERCELNPSGWRGGLLLLLFRKEKERTTGTQ